MFDARFWLPESINSMAEGTDQFFMVLIWVSVVSLLVVLGPMVWMMFRYRSSQDIDRSAPPSHHLGLEIVWTVIPTAILIGVFFWGATGYTKMVVPPTDAMEIRATGQKWFWTFDYPEAGIRVRASLEADEERVKNGTPPGLVVPVNTPIKIVGSSADVIHSFYVPAFRVKKDVLPNRYTVATFQATKEGTYDLFCAEYCGTKHSKMITKVSVVSQEAFDEFIAKQSEESDKPIDGATVFNTSGCAGCHAVVESSGGIGPSLHELWGRTETLVDETTVVADENYIRESIVNPMEKIVLGYSPMMPNYSGQLSEDELNALVLYIRDLSSKKEGAE